MIEAARLSGIGRMLLSPSALAAFLIIAEAPCSMRELAKAMDVRSLDTARHHVNKLRGAGLVETWTQEGDLWVRTSDAVKVDPAVATIETSCFGNTIEITIGRYPKEKATDD